MTKQSEQDAQDARDWANEIADEVVSNFARLYPKLALPFDVWATLREMIQREAHGCISEISTSALDIAEDELYQRAATEAGLR